MLVCCILVLPAITAYTLRTENMYGTRIDMCTHAGMCGRTRACRHARADMHACVCEAVVMGRAHIYATMQNMTFRVAIRAPAHSCWTCGYSSAAAGIRVRKWKYNCYMVMHMCRRPGSFGGGGGAAVLPAPRDTASNCNQP
jgi:hypothetical protein